MVNFDDKDLYDSRNPEHDTFTKEPCELFTYILDCAHDSGLPHEEIDMEYSWCVKVFSPEDKDVYIEIDGSVNSDYSVYGFHCKSVRMQFESITTKNSFAVTPDLIKAFLTVLDFKLA